MIGIDWDKGKDESDSNSLLEEEPLEYLMFWWFYIYNPIPLLRVAFRCKLNVRIHQDTAGFQQRMRLLPRNEVTKIVNFHMYVISSESNKSVVVKFITNSIFASYC